MLSTGIDIDAETGLGDDRDARDRRRDDASELPAHTISDEHLVETIGERNGNDDHRTTAPFTAVTIASTTSSIGCEESMAISATSA
jgi:hypothetical protein